MSFKKLLAYAAFVVILTLAGFAFFFLLQKRSTKSLSESIAQQLAVKYEQPASSFTVETTFRDSSFARGTVRYANNLGGGGLWFAAKMPTGWALAYDGNGIMPCDIASRYSLPVTLVPSCIDTAHGNVLIKR